TYKSHAHYDWSIETHTHRPKQRLPLKNYLTHTHTTTPHYLTHTHTHPHTHSHTQTHTHTHTHTHTDPECILLQAEVLVEAGVEQSGVEQQLGVGHGQQQLVDVQQVGGRREGARERGSETRVAPALLFLLQHLFILLFFHFGCGERQGGGVLGHLHRLFQTHFLQRGREYEYMHIHHHTNTHTHTHTHTLYTEMEYPPREAGWYKIR